LTDALLVTCDTLLAGLDPEQREVVFATRGPVCVLAGAGTGKTRAITYRIAYAASAGIVNPAHVLAVTFTVRAAGELRGRLRQLGAGLVRASTFHAAALRQLNYFWPRVIGGRPPRLVDAKAGLVREAASLAHVRLEGGPGGKGAGLAEAAAEIEWAKVTQIRPDGYARAAAAAGRSPAAGADHVASVYAAYEQLRRERHLIDFESVLELTAAILADNRAAADQVRDTFRYFVVDEYQDVNPLQKLLLDAWLGDRDDLCVVGDPHQVI
jgi:DNA helicase-2/ATP-dependent DNA helicase PcrA